MQVTVWSAKPVQVGNLEIDVKNKNDIYEVGYVQYIEGIPIEDPASTSRIMRPIGGMFEI